MSKDERDQSRVLRIIITSVIRISGDMVRLNMVEKSFSRRYVDNTTLKKIKYGVN